MHEYVTGGGLAGEALPPSWAAEGGAMRRALAEDFAALPGVGVVMTLDDRLPDEPGPWETIRVGPGRERETFARLAAGSSATALIAPETGGILADRARIIEGVGGRSLGSAPAAIDLAGDKFAMAAHWQSAGVPTPACRRVVPALGLPRDAPYPAVLKPADGAGACETFFLPGPDSLPTEARAMASALLQPFVAGTPLSASFLNGAEGVGLVGVAHQRIERVDQSFQYRGGTVPAGPDVPLVEVLRALRMVQGLRGWVGVDLIWDGETRRLTVLEINPRLTTSYVGFRALLPVGSLARWWLSAMDGEFPRGESLVRCIRAITPLTFAADGRILSKG